MQRNNLKDRVLDSISILVAKYPYHIFVFSIALAVLSVDYTVHNIKFLTKRNDLISPNAKYYINYQKFRKEFKSFDGLVVAVEGADKIKVKNFVDDLSHFFNSKPEYFQDVFYKIDSEFFKTRKLLFLSLNDLNKLKSKIKSNKNFIGGLMEKPGLESFFTQVNQEISKAMAGSLISDFFGGKNKKDKEENNSALDLYLVSSILKQMVNNINGQKNYSSPWENIFVKKKGDMDEDGYLTSNKGGFYFVFVNPAENQADFARASVPIKIARNYIKTLLPKYPDIAAGVTGPAALSADEMITSKNDTVKASFYALIGISILLTLSLRGIVLPCLAVFTLIISLCWSLGFITLTVGHLTILSVVFTTILIGLGIDFGIHFIMRYQEEKSSGRDIKESLNESLIGTGKGLVAGAITTSFAFMATIFANFRGIAELGFIAGTGIIICLIATVTLLPAMIIIIERLQQNKWIEEISNSLPFNYNISNKTIYPVFDLLLNNPKYTIATGAIFAFFSIIAIKEIRFDYNILNLQASGLESVDYEIKIINNSDKSAWYGAIVVDSFDKVLSTKKRLESLSTVNSVSSIASLLPEKQGEKTKIIKKISDLYGKFPPANYNNDSVNLNNLSRILKKIHFKLRKDKNDNWEAGRKPSDDSILEVRKLIEDFNLLVKQGNINNIEKKLDQYQEVLFLDFGKKLKSFREALNPTRISINNIPANLKERFVGKNGNFLLQVFPNVNIYDREPMERFTSDIWSVDPDATGTAVTASESSRLMKEGYIRGGVYASVAIIVFIWISFKDWLCALLAMLPLLLGAVWTLGLMVLLDIPFNLANLIILPLIIGIGVDNGIHIVHRFREDKENSISPVYTSTGKAVMLSSFTTMIGFGSLMIASHRGIQSIGVLLTIGVACCMVASLTILPAMLKLMREKGWKPRNY